MKASFAPLAFTVTPLETTKWSMLPSVLLPISKVSVGALSIVPAPPSVNPGPKLDPCSRSSSPMAPSIMSKEPPPLEPVPALSVRLAPADGVAVLPTVMVPAPVRAESVAPEATEIAVLPSGLADVRAKVPALTVVGPT